MYKKGTTKIIFNNTRILSTLVSKIRSSDSIRGCIAWLTHPRLLDALESTDSELILTRHKCNRWKRNIKVKFLGSGRGKKSIIMHNKFIIGFKNGSPKWCATGSYNYSKSACRHFENVVVFDDPDIATAFYGEFQRLKNIRK